MEPSMDRRRLVGPCAAAATAWLALAGRRGKLIVGMRIGTMSGGTIPGVGTSEWSWLTVGVKYGLFMGDASATKFPVKTGPMRAR